MRTHRANAPRRGPGSHARPAAEYRGWEARREPGPLGHSHRPPHRVRGRLLRRRRDGTRLAPRGSGPRDQPARQARAAGRPAGPGPQPLPVRGADRGDRRDAAVRYLRRGHPGRATCARRCCIMACPAGSPRPSRSPWSRWAISFFSLVLGELAPKRIALQRSESIALFAAPVLDRISVAARPVVWLLSQSTNLVVRLLGGDPKLGRGVITEEELRDLVTGNQLLSADERYIVSEVFDAGKRQLREVLVPRTEVEFLAADTPITRGGQDRGGGAALAFPRLPGLLRQRGRLRARSGPAGPGPGRPAGPAHAGGRRRPPGQAAPDQQAGAVRAVGDAAGPGAPGHRGGRVRRHRRHRHPGGPGRGADRRHLGRVRHRGAARPASCSAASSRWTACSTWTSSPSRPG